MAAPTTYAAGVLCWREVGDDVEVLLVRRPDYDDVSVPKGKLDPGELLPQTALRELVEETGVHAVLGAPIGSVRYPVGGRPKVVHYWAAEVRDEQVQLGAFIPNDEISGIEWVPIAKAKKLVSYRHDVDMIATLQDRLKRRHARTFAIILARHAKALPATDWDGPDAHRPLLYRGGQQAERIAPAIAAFGPGRLVSSTAERCLQTMAPLAHLVQLPVKLVEGISQVAHESRRGRAEQQIVKRLGKRQTVVLCSHGPVLPLMAEAIRHATSAHRSPELTRAANLGTGDFAVFHLSLDTETPHLVEVEIHSPEWR